MQKLSGSIKHKEESGLTPFEKARYNSAKFVAGFAAAYEFQELLARLKFLEGLRDITKKLDTNDSKFADNNRSNLAIDNEILSIELAIKQWCDIYGEDSEA